MAMALNLESGLITALTANRDAPNTGGGERLWLNMARRMKPKLVVESDNFEADSIVSTSGMSWDEASRRYEEAEYQEFATRLKYNKKLVSPCNEACAVLMGMKNIRLILAWWREAEEQRPITRDGSSMK